MASILDKIVSHKRGEIEAAESVRSLSELRAQLKDTSPPRDFLGSIRQDGISLIAEVKKASPSKGLIREDFDPPSLAKAYEEGGARCVSVLTDENFFQGHLDFLKSVRQAINLPVLRKDFILSEYQVVEARVAGADAVLLIAECLSPEELKNLHDQIVGLGMTPLVELYDEQNVSPVLACTPKLVGINNRDLNTFEIDLHHTIRLRQQIPENICLVGESGIFSNEDVQLLGNAGVDAILVGESLMRAENVAQATSELMGY